MSHPKTSAAPLAARLTDLRKRIPTWRADALLITNPRDIRYLTGFVGEDSWAVVPADGRKITIISDSRFDEEIDKAAPQASKHIRDTRTSLTAALDQVLLKHKARYVAIQEAYLTLQQTRVLGEKVKGVTFIPVDDGLLTQRSIKDKGEIALIRRAVHIQQEGFRRTMAMVKPGMTELEITARLEFEMMSLGAEGPAFQSIVAAGANGSLPHYRPGLAKVQKNNILLVDWGAKVGGYHSDMTRTVALGKMPARIKEIYQIVLDAQLAAIAAIKPGALLKDVDAAARNLINKAGYEKQFQHGLGHGIGLQIHESPRFGLNAEGECQENQVVTVEPGIYLPGIGGVRLEDDVLVTKKGHVVLCDLPKGLESAMI
jgi:Xaa-Pro aminopeptidase